MGLSCRPTISSSIRKATTRIQFFFKKTAPLSIDEKEVLFHVMIGRYKVENKFELKQMTRNKKLEVD